jgi:hypothetical protein
MAEVRLLLNSNSNNNSISRSNHNINRSLLLEEEEEEVESLRSNNSNSINRSSHKLEEVDRWLAVALDTLSRSNLFGTINTPNSSHLSSKRTLFKNGSMRMFQLPLRNRKKKKKKTNEISYSVLTKIAVELYLRLNWQHCRFTTSRLALTLQSSWSRSLTRISAVQFRSTSTSLCTRFCRSCSRLLPLPTETALAHWTLKRFTARFTDLDSTWFRTRPFSACTPNTICIAPVTSHFQAFCASPPTLPCFARNSSAWTRNAPVNCKLTSINSWNWQATCN